jgi:CRP/FNR family transcriptional regulator, cyclic AMP receptor protein
VQHDPFRYTGYTNGTRNGEVFIGMSGMCVRWDTKERQVVRSHIPKSELGLLAQVPLFAQCSQHERREIARLGSPTHVGPGTVLTKENGPGAEFFLLLEGEAVCMIGGMTEETLTSGDYFGELSLLDGGPRMATITASKNCSLLVFSRGEFGTLVRNSSSIAIKLLRHLSSRLRKAEAALTH